MKTIKFPNLADIKDLLKRPLFESETIKESVLSIINEVKLNGDKALIEFTQKFDDVGLDKLRVSDDEIDNSEKGININLKTAIEVARKNIYKFHNSQVNTISKIEIEDGITCWRKDVPIQKVGLYIPGGSSPLFSTLLMLAIPAKIASCEEIVICSPPQKDGNVATTILFVAKLLGIKNIFKIGGAQAIAALTFGTETIPKVDKIFGPGNQWVTVAKQIVNSFGVAIDMPAGPSEVLVIADDTANAKFVASDLLSQAEHGADSQVILISTSEILISKVEDEVNILTTQLSRKVIIEQSLKNCIMILVNNLDEAIAISNIYAPEHLILAVDNPETLAEKVINAGSVFLGNYSPESAGDYATGTNHTLPTNGFASTYSGVSLDSFMKKITFQKLTKSGLSQIATAIEIMAEAEGLDAHKLAVTLRRSE